MVLLFYIFTVRGVMNINPTNQQNFEGKVIQYGKISRPLRPLVDRNRAVLNAQIKEMPFDMLVKESKSGKSITISTNVEGADTFIVNRRKPNIAETGAMAVSDGMKKSEAYKKLVKANEILNYKKMEMIHVLDGNFKEAKVAHEQMAEVAVNDFDTYKQVTNFKITDLPPGIGKVLFTNSLKYKAYYAFTPKTAEEKQLEKMNKEYVKKMKEEKKEIKPQIIRFPQYYPGF